MFYTNILYVLLWCR